MDNDFDREALEIQNYLRFIRSHLPTHGNFAEDMINACESAQATMSALRAKWLARMEPIGETALTELVRALETEKWLKAMQENRDAWLQKYDKLLPVIEICERLQEQVCWTLDGEGIGNELARALNKLSAAPTERVSEEARDAQRYRFLRDTYATQQSSSYVTWSTRLPKGHASPMNAQTFDAAIDAALAAERKEPHHD